MFIGAAVGKALVGSAVTGSAGLFGAAGKATLGGLGTAISVGGTLLQTRYAGAASDSAAAQSAANAQTMRENARMAREDAMRQARRESREHRRLLSAQRAGYAAAGLVPGSGSAAAVRDATKFNQELSLQETMRSGEYQARNYHITANNYLAEASAHRSASSQYRAGGLAGAGAGLIAGYARNRRTSQTLPVRRAGMY